MVVTVAQANTAGFFSSKHINMLHLEQSFTSLWANRLFLSTLCLKYSQLPLSQRGISKDVSAISFSPSESQADPMLLRLVAIGHGVILERVFLGLCM